MNETFSFNRFFTYFKYDLTQMWRNHSRAAILIGGAGAIFYVLWVTFSLVFGQHWSAPGFGPRFMVFLLAFAILEFYQVRTYGQLTEKRAGSFWLMIPASRTEKFVSMLLVTVVVIPLLFFVLYMAVDGFLSLVDPNVGKAIIVSLGSGYTEFLDAMAQLSAAELPSFNPVTLVVASAFSGISSLLYFLLCGICFRRNKLVSAIAILFLASTLLSLSSGFLIPVLTNMDITEEIAMRWVNGSINFGLVLSILMAVGFGWGVWHRVKTLQH